MVLQYFILLKFFLISLVLSISSALGVAKLKDKLKLRTFADWWKWNYKTSQSFLRIIPGLINCCTSRWFLNHPSRCDNNNIKNNIQPKHFSLWGSTFLDLLMFFLYSSFWLLGNKWNILLYKNRLSKIIKSFLWQEYKLTLMRHKETMFSPNNCQMNDLSLLVF